MARPCAATSPRAPLVELRRAARRLALLLPFGAALAHAASAQQPALTHPETLTGQVSTALGAPLGGAVIIVTMAPDRLQFSDTTDASGRYRIAVANGTGDYLVYVSALGHTAFRKRVTRAGSDSVLVVNAALASSVEQLKTVQVAARRIVPSRISSSTADPGAAERLPDALDGVLSPDQTGDIATLATTVPGASAVAGGYSVLGLGAAQNSATVNGLGFGAGSLPRDVRTTARVSTSTYDPARGWFSGSNVNLELAGGGLFGFARGHVTLDAPALQVTDAASASAGQRYANLRASAGADGPLTWENKHFYNVAAQVERRTSDIASVLNADPRFLESLGVSADSVLRFTDVLRGAGVPITASALPASRTTDGGSFLARLERTQTDFKTFTTVKTTYGLLVFGQLSRDRGINIGALGTPARGGESLQQSGGVQGVYSRYFHTDYLNETRSSLTGSRRHDTSLLAVPEGRVLVQSTFDADPGAVSTLSFGGNSSGRGDSDSWTWETVNTTRFYVQGLSAHNVRITTDVRVDGTSYASGTNQFGTFSYASLAGVAGNTPSSYSRTLSSPRRTGQIVNAFAAIGDLWRISPRLQIMYGARLEGNVYGQRPALNTAVASAFNARTDYAPNTMHVSPRLGFTWYRMAQIANSGKDGPMGSYTFVTPRSLRGGIGEFRNMLAPSLLSDARALTGLPGGETRISCIGAATPVADWARYTSDAATIPRDCVGSDASTLADAAPNVRLIGSGFRPPTSWRANLAYATSTASVEWSLEGIYSLNLHQPGSVDLNFRGAPAFTLADDARPVFVPAAAIVMATGAVSSTASRITPAFGRVLSAQSDLRSLSRQLTLSARPSPRIMRNWYASAAYTFAETRAESRGFDGSTSASPLERSWARADFDARHQLLAQLGYNWKGITVAGFTRVRSGLPYTPLIAGDVNGDGLSNDRAFIEPGSALPRCLQRQAGRIAARNSCEGPWSTMLNAGLSVTQAALRSHRISRIAVNFSNPLGGLDQLVHGSSGLHGWGSATAPDPVLHVVRGFDPTARRFVYAVNPRFGSARSTSTMWRTPFRMTIDVSLDLGKPVPVQQLNQWLKPGRTGGTAKRLTIDDLKKRYERNVPDPFKLVLQDSDSLLVNRAQVEALQRAQVPYRLRMDSLWIALATEMAALDNEYDDARALRRQEAAVDAGWEITRVAVHTSVAPVLTRVQLGLMPNWVASLYRADKATQYRVYLAGPTR